MACRHGSTPRTRITMARRRWAVRRLLLVALFSLLAVVGTRIDISEATPLWWAGADSEASAAGLSEAVRFQEDCSDKLQAGQVEAAQVLCRRAGAILAQLRDSLRVASALDQLAAMYRALGEEAAAQAPARRALSIREASLPPNHPDIATSLNTVAELLRVAGDYDTAEALHRRALAIRENVPGADAAVANSLNNLSMVLKAKGDYRAAEPLYRRAVEIRERTAGSDHPSVAVPLNNLARLEQARGDYETAERHFRRTLLIREQALGPHHPDVANSLNNLAELLHAKGDYEAAEPLFRRALAIWERRLGPHDPAVATALNNLAALLQSKRNYDAAEPLSRRALAIWERVRGPEHLDVAVGLDNLAGLLQAEGKLDAAEPLFRRAIAIRERTAAPEQSVAISLDNLAGLLRAKGDLRAAEPLCARALAVWQRTRGPEHPAFATSLNNFALLLQAKGDYAAAEPLYRRALAIREKALGPGHPDVAIVLNNIAYLSWQAGDEETARGVLARLLEVEERHLARMMHAMPEAEARPFVGTVRASLDFVLTLQSEVEDDVSLRRLGLTTVLRRKGRVLDTLGLNLETIRRHADEQDRERFARLMHRRDQLSRLEVLGPGDRPLEFYMIDVHEVVADIAALERELHAKAGALGRLISPVELSDVQRAIPDNAALIEFVRFFAFSRPARAGDEVPPPAPRYGAYVLSAEGEPAWIDLGEAQSLETLIGSARPVLRDPTAPPKSTEALANDLYVRLFAPLAAQLGNASQLFISPDGDVNLVPFAALRSTDGRYLVERYTLTYLGSGRDLVRMGEPALATSGAFLAAAPDFDAAPDENTDGRTAAQPQAVAPAREPRRPRFEPLPNALKEAQALETLFATKALTGRRATEAAVKMVHSPSIFHLATHGYFLDDDPPMRAARATSAIEPAPTGPLGAFREATLARTPLLRSGLALAGANRSADGGEDGILTALEMSGLDLWGTHLVVLSACDTGLGTIANGEGVYGLRRAVFLAGAQTLVSSLWKVNDSSTQELMLRYYARLRAGEGRSESLRCAQLEMLHSDAWSRPAFWAAFISSGDWRPLRWPGYRCAR